jgi:hypothetical protein
MEDIRCHLQTLLVTIIVGELGICQTLMPTSSVLQSTRSQHILKNLIDSLGLTTSLRVISRIEAQLGIQGFMQPFPELRSKLSSCIRHNLL